MPLKFLSYKIRVAYFKGGKEEGREEGREEGKEGRKEKVVMCPCLPATWCSLLPHRSLTQGCAVWALVRRVLALLFA